MFLVTIDAYSKWPEVVEISSGIYQQLEPGLKVGWMTRTIWVTFLEGQVGLICKLNYLDLTRIFNRSRVL